MSLDHRAAQPLNFVSCLQLLFIAYKLAGIIDWSWFLVLSPFILFNGLKLISVALEKRLKAKSKS